jgi:peptidoglycan/LPS O-acetylase OafA/YrhL
VLAIVAGGVSLETFVAPYLPRWFLTLGDASYSIYLSHGFMLPILDLLFGSIVSSVLWTEGLTKFCASCSACPHTHRRN